MGNMQDIGYIRVAKELSPAEIKCKVWSKKFKVWQIQKTENISGNVRKCVGKDRSF